MTGSVFARAAAAAQVDAGAWGAVWALTWSGFQTVWRSILFWIIVGLSVVHIAIRATIIAVVALFEQEALPFFFNGSFFIETIVLQATGPLVIVLGTVGARVTARDRMMGGLEFILSKAIPPWGYVVARVLTPLLAAVAIVLLPALLLVLLLVILVDPLPDNAGSLFWGVVGFAAVYSVALAPLAAGLGSLVDNPRRATALWLVVVWLTAPLVPIANEFGADWWWMFNPSTAIGATASTLLDVEFPGEDLWVGWFLVAAFALVPLLVLRWRVREVVR